MKLIIASNVGICKNTPQPQAFVLPWRGEAVQRHHRAIGVLDVAAAPATGLSEACTHFLPIGPCNSEIPRSVDQLRSKATAWRASVERAWKASLKSSPSLRTSPN